MESCIALDNRFINYKKYRSLGAIFFGCLPNKIVFVLDIYSASYQISNSNSYR